MPHICKALSRSQGDDRRHRRRRRSRRAALATAHDAFRPIPSLSADQKRVNVSGITILRIANGKIVAGWDKWDQLGLLEQIGAVPVQVRSRFGRPDPRRVSLTPVISWCTVSTGDVAVAHGLAVSLCCGRIPASEDQRMLLSGIFPPITTPFYPDGNVYYKKLEANVERYSRTPVAGIVVLGSTGEAILLLRRRTAPGSEDGASRCCQPQGPDRGHGYRVGQRDAPASPTTRRS